MRLLRAFDMVSVIEACEKIKSHLSQLVPIELLVIDNIANPISLLMNKGRLQGYIFCIWFNGRSRVNAVVYKCSSTNDYTVRSHHPPRQHCRKGRHELAICILVYENQTRTRRYMDILRRYMYAITLPCGGRYRCCGSNTESDRGRPPNYVDLTVGMRMDKSLNEESHLWVLLKTA